MYLILGKLRVGKRNIHFKNYFVIQLMYHSEFKSFFRQLVLIKVHL